MAEACAHKNVLLSWYKCLFQPRLLDEYSDPVDLKKQIQEEMLGVCAADPVVEDDYSVPYEVKKLFRGRFDISCILCSFHRSPHRCIHAHRMCKKTIGFLWKRNQKYKDTNKSENKT